MTITRRRIEAALAALALAMAACGGGGQSIECEGYLACVVKLGGTSASLDSKYGPSGTCWVDSQAAESCTKFCKAALAAFPRDAGC